jgi:hypothetical protein
MTAIDNPTEPTNKENLKAKAFFALGIITVPAVIYALCALSAWDIWITEWPVYLRAAFLIGSFLAVFSNKK